MKICPICDKKITGTWCRSCHRFVQPWVIKNDIYINERHGEAHHSECEYHNPVMQFDSQDYMKPGYEQKIYGTIENRTEKKRNSEKKKKAGKPVKIIIIAYIVIFVLGVLGEVVTELLDEFGGMENVVEAVSDFFGGKEEESQGANHKTGKEGKEEPTLSEEHEYLAAIEPAYSSEEEQDEIYYYYDVDDVKSLHHACDSTHMEDDMDSFMTKVAEVFPEYDFSQEQFSDETRNYRMVYSGEYEYVWFETVYQLECDDFLLYISADTSTNELHAYEFYLNQPESKEYAAVYSWFAEYLPEVFGSVEEVEAYVKQAEEVGGYETMDYGDYYIWCYVSDGEVGFGVERNYF